MSEETTALRTTHRYTRHCAEEPAGDKQSLWVGDQSPVVFRVQKGEEMYPFTLKACRKEQRHRLACSASLE